MYAAAGGGSQWRHESRWRDDNGSSLDPDTVRLKAQLAQLDQLERGVQADLQAAERRQRPGAAAAATLAGTALSGERQAWSRISETVLDFYETCSRLSDELAHAEASQYTAHQELWEARYAEGVLEARLDEANRLLDAASLEPGLLAAPAEDDGRADLEAALQSAVLSWQEVDGKLGQANEQCVSLSERMVKLQEELRQHARETEDTELHVVEVSDAYVRSRKELAELTSRLEHVENEDFAMARELENQKALVKSTSGMHRDTNDKVLGLVARCAVARVQGRLEHEHDEARIHEEAKQAHTILKRNSVLGFEMRDAERMKDLVIFERCEAMYDTQVARDEKSVLAKKAKALREKLSVEDKLIQVLQSELGAYQHELADSQAALSDLRSEQNLSMAKAEVEGRGREIAERGRFISRSASFETEVETSRSHIRELLSRLNHIQDLEEDELDEVTDQIIASTRSFTRRKSWAGHGQKEYGSEAVQPTEVGHIVSAPAVKGLQRGASVRFVTSGDTVHEFDRLEHLEVAVGHTALEQARVAVCVNAYKSSLRSYAFTKDAAVKVCVHMYLKALQREQPKRFSSQQSSHSTAWQEVSNLKAALALEAAERRRVEEELSQLKAVSSMRKQADSPRESPHAEDLREALQIVETLASDMTGRAPSIPEAYGSSARRAAALLARAIAGLGGKAPLLGSPPPLSSGSSPGRSTLATGADKAGGKHSRAAAAAAGVLLMKAVAKDMADDEEAASATVSCRCGCGWMSRGGTWCANRMRNEENQKKAVSIKSQMSQHPQQAAAEDERKRAAAEQASSSVSTAVTSQPLAGDGRSTRASSSFFSDGGTFSPHDSEQEDPPAPPAQVFTYQQDSRRSW